MRLPGRMANTKHERADKSGSHAMTPALLDYDGFEARYGIKKGTVASWVSRKAIPHVRLSARLVRFDPTEIDAWLTARRVAVAK